ncbi:DUF4326 domain-containing protein [Rhodococcus hoagii]|nr:DUF4326 domain-containing protein [Prescottella equi]
MAKRIQRKRSKGWRMPEGAVYVGRPSRWGNPFKAGEGKWMLRHSDQARVHFFPRTTQEAVDMFRLIVSNDETAATIRAELAGKDLACWCPLDQSCHADVLLEIANAAEGGDQP